MIKYFYLPGDTDIHVDFVLINPLVYWLLVYYHPKLINVF